MSVFTAFTGQGDDSCIEEDAKKLLKSLSEIKEVKEKFYLAGGTALSLYFPYRESFDLDFFTEGSFTPLLLAKTLKDLFHDGIEDVSFSENTLFCSINKVKVSFITYPFELLKKGIVYKNIEIASLEDIATMKLLAILQRGKKRDFYDMYIINTNFIPLKKVVSLAEKRFMDLNKWRVITSLTYFEDAEKGLLESRDGVISLKKKDIPHWTEIKKFFIKESKNV